MQALIGRYQHLTKWLVPVDNSMINTSVAEIAGHCSLWKIPRKTGGRIGPWYIPWLWLYSPNGLWFYLTIFQMLWKYINLFYVIHYSWVSLIFVLLLKIYVTQKLKFLLYFAFSKIIFPWFKYHGHWQNISWAQLTSIINFRHFYSFLTSYSRIPTLYFYYKWFLTGFRVYIGPGRSLSK